MPCTVEHTAIDMLVHAGILDFSNILLTNQQSRTIRNTEINYCIPDVCVLFFLPFQLGYFKTNSFLFLMGRTFCNNAQKPRNYREL